MTSKREGLSAEEAGVRRSVSDLGILEITHSIIGCATHTWLHRTNTVKAPFNLHSNLLGLLKSIVVFLHQPISISQSSHLNDILLEIFVLLLFQNRFQEMVARCPIHFQNCLCYKSINSAFRSMVQLIPIRVVQCLVFNGFRPILLNVSPFLLARKLIE